MPNLVWMQTKGKGLLPALHRQQTLGAYGTMALDRFGIAFWSVGWLAQGNDGGRRPLGQVAETT